jgi:D-aspartate ligase
MNGRADASTSRLAIVLGLTANGYGVIRSLAAHGIPVVGLYEREDELARYSRFCGDAYRCADDAEALARLTSLAAASREPPVLIPTSDRWVFFLAEHRAQLETLCTHYWTDLQLLTLIAEKTSCTEVCARIGIPTPLTREPPPTGDIAAAAADFSFPCLVKLTNTVGEPLPGDKKALVFDTPRDLADFYAQHPSFRSRTFWQELIEGGDDAMFEYTLLTPVGASSPVGVCTHKIRQYPPRYGLMSFGRTESIAQLRDYTLRLVRELKWSGPASVEFKYRASDGGYYFIETNPRLPWFNRIFTASGVDLPLLMYRDLTGSSVHTAAQRDGVYWVSLEQDVGSFWRRRADGDWPVRKWIRSLLKARAFAWFSVADPQPMLRSTLGLVKSMVGRARRGAPS